MTRSCPLLAVTMGDPAGVGPEIIAKALSKEAFYANYQPIVIGDAGVMGEALGAVGEWTCAQKIKRLGRISEAEPLSGVIQVLDLQNVPAGPVAYGQGRAEYGKAAGEYIEKAVGLAMRNEVDGIVTAPIQKEAFKLAGFKYAGHTDMLTDLTNAKRSALMLAVDGFRVVHVTLHMALKDALGQITFERVYDCIRTAEEGCRALGIEKPRIGVAGLNPHAGEGGHFGSEEEEVIRPAVQKAKGEGLNVEGPFAADTVFPALKGGRFDIGVAMYHDQGGIPMKLLAFDWDAAKGMWSRIRGVNVTLGLPIVRTSVAHGTGFEIAGKGTADSTSLEEAMAMAAALANFRIKQR